MADQIGKTGQLTENLNGSDYTLLLNLWELGNRLFDARWTSKNGSSPLDVETKKPSFIAQEWLKVLWKMTPEWFERSQDGLKNYVAASLRRGETAWPPSPLEFLALGDNQQKPDDWRHAGEAYRMKSSSETKQLEHKKEKRHTLAAKEGIAAMKAAAGVK